MQVSAQTGLYIHMPWCVQKCPYCDFNSHALKQPLAERDYVDALKRDIAFEADRWSDRTFTSIFFGGGTPSLFSSDAIDEILHTASSQFSLHSNIEVTLEANPGTAEASNFKGYIDAGISRLSMGFQSLDNAMLRKLGRIHTANEAIQAYQLARDAGFNNINLDLMFGLPEQTPAAAIADLQQVLDLAPEHVSWYQLTLEPNTAFAHSPPQLPSHDLCHHMQQEGIKLLTTHGFQRYEVSAYSKSGKQCQHNLNYWRFGDYLGIGAGAHGKLTGQGITRFARRRHPNDYLAYAGTLEVLQKAESVPSDQYFFEYLLNRLRLKEPFGLNEAADTTGETSDTLRQKLSSALDMGLIELTADECRTTEKGFNYIDEILIDVLMDK